MAIDPNNPLLNGPKRVQKPTSASLSVVAANKLVDKDYKALYERALVRQGVLESQVRKLNAQLLNKIPAGFGRSQKRK